MHVILATTQLVCVAVQLVTGMDVMYDDKPVVAVVMCQQELGGCLGDDPLPGWMLSACGLQAC
jgi:hypothetical protein